MVLFAKNNDNDNNNNNNSFFLLLIEHDQQNIPCTSQRTSLDSQIWPFLVVSTKPKLFTNSTVIALWSRTAKNTDCSTGPLTRPFARSLAPLTRSLAPDCSLRPRPLLRSLVCSLAHSDHSLTRETVNF